MKSFKEYYESRLVNYIAPDADRDMVHRVAGQVNQLPEVFIEFLEGLPGLIAANILRGARENLRRPQAISVPLIHVNQIEGEVLSALKQTGFYQKMIELAQRAYGY